MYSYMMNEKQNSVSFTFELCIWFANSMLLEYTFGGEMINKSYMEQYQAFLSVQFMYFWHQSLLSTVKINDICINPSHLSLEQRQTYD